MTALLNVSDLSAAVDGKTILQGLSLEEAASRSGQSVALVKVNIHRGLGRLAAFVQDQADDA